MADLVIRNENLAYRLLDIAHRENRPIEAVLESMLEQYRPQTPLPAVDPAAREAAFRRVRQGFYRRARRYWAETGNQEQLALTDAELDEQFWLIDPDGIPRLKSEIGMIELPPDPLMMMVEDAEGLNLRSGRSDISENFGKVVGDSMAEDFFKRRGRENDGTHSG